jgi:hypothetical protein
MRYIESPLLACGEQSGFIQAEKNNNWVSKPLPETGRGMEVG